MNGTEQRNHKTATTQLASALETVANATAQRLESHGVELARLRESISTEHTHRLELAKEQRGYVDARDQELRDCCQERWDATAQTTKRLADGIAELRRRGFWSRLNWLVTGR